MQAMQSSNVKLLALALTLAAALPSGAALATKYLNAETTVGTISGPDLIPISAGGTQTRNVAFNTVSNQLWTNWTASITSTTNTGSLLRLQRLRNLLNGHTNGINVMFVGDSMNRSAPSNYGDGIGSIGYYLYRDLLTAFGGLRSVQWAGPDNRDLGNLGQSGGGQIGAVAPSASGHWQRMITITNDGAYITYGINLGGPSTYSVGLNWEAWTNGGTMLFQVCTNGTLSGWTTIATLSGAAYGLTNTWRSTNIVNPFNTQIQVQILNQGNGTNFVHGPTWQFKPSTQAGVNVAWLASDGIAITNMLNGASNTAFLTVSNLNPDLIVYHFKEDTTIKSNDVWNLDQMLTKAATNADLLYIGTPYNFTTGAIAWLDAGTWNQYQRGVALAAGHSYWDGMTPSVDVYWAYTNGWLYEDAYRVHLTDKGASAEASILRNDLGLFPLAKAGLTENPNSLLYYSPQFSEFVQLLAGSGSAGVLDNYAQTVAAGFTGAFMTSGWKVNDGSDAGGGFYIPVPPQWGPKVSVTVHYGKGNTGNPNTGVVAMYLGGAELPFFWNGYTNGGTLKYNANQASTYWRPTIPTNQFWTAVTNGLVQFEDRSVGNPRWIYFRNVPTDGARTYLTNYYFYAIGLQEVQ